MNTVPGESYYRLSTNSYSYTDDTLLKANLFDQLTQTKKLKFRTRLVEHKTFLEKLLPKQLSVLMLTLKCAMANQNADYALPQEAWIIILQFYQLIIETPQHAYKPNAVHLPQSETQKLLNSLGFDDFNPFKQFTKTFRNINLFIEENARGLMQTQQTKTLISNLKIHAENKTLSIDTFKEIMDDTRGDIQTFLDKHPKGPSFAANSLVNRHLIRKNAAIPVTATTTTTTSTSITTTTTSIVGSTTAVGTHHTTTTIKQNAFSLFQSMFSKKQPDSISTAQTSSSQKSENSEIGDFEIIEKSSSSPKETLAIEKSSSSPKKTLASVYSVNF